MKKANHKTINKTQKEIIFYAQKLPPVKQAEVLDFVKWLWGGPGAEKEFTGEEIEKIESLSKKRGGKKFENWKDAKKYLEKLMK